MSADMISSTMANAVAKAQAAAAARAAAISAAVLGTSASLSTSVAPPAPVSVAPTPASAPVTNVSLASALAKAQSVAQSALGAAAVASNITASLKPTSEEDFIPASNAPELDSNGDLMSGFDGTLLIDAEMMKLNNVMRERAQRAKEYQEQRRLKEAEQEQERYSTAAFYIVTVLIWLIDLVCLPFSFVCFSVLEWQPWSSSPLSLQPQLQWSVHWPLSSWMSNKTWTLMWCRARPKFAALALPFSHVFDSAFRYCCFLLFAIDINMILTMGFHLDFDWSECRRPTGFGR
jgi:hypothetical protein